MFNRSFIEDPKKLWLHPSAEMQDDDIKFGFIPNDTTAFLKPYGWELQEFLSFGEGSVRLNRSPQGLTPNEVSEKKRFNESGICLFRPRNHS